MFKDLKKNIQVVQYVFKFCPFYAIFTIVYIIANTFQVLQKAFLIQSVGEIIADYINNGGSFERSFQDVIKELVIYVSIIAGITVIKTIYTSYIKGKYRTIYIIKMQRMMFEKAKNVDFSDFDNPEFYDMYSRAMRDGTFRGIRVFEDFTNFLSSMLNIFALGTLIVVGDPILIVVIIISVVARVVIANKVNKNTHALDKNTEIDRRMYHYVNRTFYQQRFAAELKTTPINELLIEKCQEAQNSIDRQYIATHKKNTILKSISLFISNIFENGGMYGYLVYKMFHGLTIPVFSSMIYAVTQFSGDLFQAASFLNRIKDNSLYIDYFLEYMQYLPKLEFDGIMDLDEPFETLTFQDVNFSYPNTDYFALSNINLHIKAGDKLAIVGLNGAGKTTLIKLLLKFYNPDSGDIYYNNQTIRETKEDVIRSKYSIIFQDYRLYGVSLGENILMRKMVTPEDEAIVWNAIEKVGLKEKISSLEANIHTMYSREFEGSGVDFSGGEKQRLAIARVFASSASIYILDEPTSSLDPLAERDINRLIIDQSKDKTIIIIAHRLSTVVDANRIILMEYGKIIEEGDHLELLAKEGRYHEMFMSQATLYMRGENKNTKKPPNGNGDVEVFDID